MFSFFLEPGKPDDVERRVLQVSIWRSVESRSSDCSFNPGALLQNEWRGVSQSKSALQRQLKPRSNLRASEVQTLLNANTWKNDLLQLPPEWLEVCAVAFAHVKADGHSRTQSAAKSFTPAAIKATLYSCNDGSNVHASKAAGWTLLLSLGSASRLTVQSDNRLHTLVLKSGSALFYNASKRADVKVGYDEQEQKHCHSFMTMHRHFETENLILKSSKAQLNIVNQVFFSVNRTMNNKHYRYTEMRKCKIDEKYIFSTKSAQLIL